MDREYGQITDRPQQKYRFTSLVFKTRWGAIMVVFCTWELETALPVHKFLWGIHDSVNCQSCSSLFNNATQPTHWAARPRVLRALELEERANSRTNLILPNMLSATNRGGSSINILELNRKPTAIALCNYFLQLHCRIQIQSSLALHCLYWTAAAETCC